MGQDPRSVSEWFHFCMGILDRMDQRFGGMGPKSGETRQGFFQRMSQRRTYVPQAVYLELLDLRRRVDELEARASR